MKRNIHESVPNRLFFQINDYKMKTKALVIFLFVIFCHVSVAQERIFAPLFASDSLLEMRLSYSFKELRKNTNDSLYLPTIFYYKTNKGNWDSIGIEMRSRGNFRMKHCFFSPARIKINKKESKGTLFEGNKSLKLVLPCHANKNANDLVLKEYLCYKLYEPISDYYFKTRLIDLNLTDLDGRQDKSYIVKAFLIEDNDQVAKRFGGKIMKGKNINPYSLQDTAAVRHDFFQFMIANTDWSSLVQHNMQVMQLPPRTYIPLPYDFDMAGLVNAPYAQVSEKLEIENVRERLYRGFCRNEGLLQYVRSEFLEREPQIWEALHHIENDINKNELQGLRKYIEEFFSILRNDRKFMDNILYKCRTHT